MDATPVSAQDAPRALAALATDVWEFGLEESPISCTYLGLRRGADRIDERGPAARARREQALERFRRRLEAVPPDGLVGEDRITRTVLVRSVAEQLEAFRQRAWEWELDQLASLHITLQDVATKHPTTEPSDAATLCARLRAVPKAFDAWISDLREGLASGRTVPRVAYDRVVAQVRATAAQGAEATAFLHAVRAAPATWSAADRARALADATRAYEEAVRPAYRTLLAFLEGEYAGRAREAVGVASIPGGAEAYAFLVRHHTTTSLTPERIHQIGVEELERNEREMLEIARAQGHAGDLRAFLDRIGGDRAHRLPSREAVLERYREICARMQARLPETFGILPRMGYEIRPLEAWRERDAPAAYYQPPSLDGSRIGVFYANTHDPTSWPTYDMEALSFHEAVPGHHLQIAIAQEIEGLPDVRKHSHFTAYVEGWAHYTERLADEMGAYSGPLDRLGMLAAQAWRAARLVVDTGMHALGWSRERALDVLRRIRSGPPAEMENEIDRYVVWPGQALAYKVGQRTIVELRDRAKRRLGARFTLRGFHDEVLRHGALPLSVLEDVVRTWPGTDPA